MGKNTRLRINMHSAAFGIVISASMWEKPTKYEEEQMPLIQVKLIEGVFTNAKKKEIITKLTDTMVSIEGEALRPYTIVVLEETRSGDWGVGGKSLTTADVHAIAAGTAA
jgi:4-oxalocrotonate tautomerase